MKSSSVFRKTNKIEVGEGVDKTIFNFRQRFLVSLFSGKVKGCARIGGMILKFLIIAYFRGFRLSRQFSVEQWERFREMFSLIS